MMNSFDENSVSAYASNYVSFSLASSICNTRNLIQTFVALSIAISFWSHYVKTFLVSTMDSTLL